MTFMISLIFIKFDMVDKTGIRLRIENCTTYACWFGLGLGLELGLGCYKPDQNKLGTLVKTSQLLEVNIQRIISLQNSKLKEFPLLIPQPNI